jgi:signal transduction histidine kinase
LQEALNNVAKHSATYRSNVALEKGGGLSEFAITDNGQGFDGARVISRVVPRLMGVSGMKE